MQKITAQRKIFDRRAIYSLLSEHGQTNKRSISARGSIKPALQILKPALQNGQFEIKKRLESRYSGQAIVSANTFLIDQVIRCIFDYSTFHLFPEPNPTKGERLSLVALGGYGRGDMAPYSDIDLMFVYPWKLSARMEQVIESILYLLWDLGLKVGHSTRSVDYCLNKAKENYTVRTSILEARYVWGDKGIYQDLHRRFRNEIIPGTEAQFIRAKLDERDLRHERLGGSRYILEPNIKDGKGGLRDLHTLFWIAKYLHLVEQFGDLVNKGVLTGNEHNRFVRAENFLWRVRAYMHVVSGRADNQLTFDLQPEIARQMGYGARNGNLAVERFMKHYFLVAKTVGELTRIFCAALETERLHIPPGFGEGQIPAAADGIITQRGRLNIESKKSFAERPPRMVKIFRLSQIGNFDIHPQTLRQLQKNLRLIDNTVREDTEVNQLFIKILTDTNRSEPTLRRMNEAGVLGQLIPEFGRVVAQTQHDMYHVYTVDEHTIRAIGILSKIVDGTMKDQFPLATSLIPKILSIKALFVALFLHDIAKGHGGDHSELGAKWALRLCLRFGLNTEETDTVSWLVRKHLLFSNTAFKRDINDPQTVKSFIQEIQSTERLRLLLILTSADIYAVGPGRWSAWKRGLLETLYKTAEAQITGSDESDRSEQRIAHSKRLLREKLAHWPLKDIEKYISSHCSSYWLTVSLEAQKRHAELVRNTHISDKKIATDFFIDHELMSNEFTLYAADQPRLFSIVSGALAVSGVAILEAKVFTTNDGMALETFRVQDAIRKSIVYKKRINEVHLALEKSILGNYNFEISLNKLYPTIKGKHGMFVAPRVLIDNTMSNNHTLIEVTAKDRAGLLHIISRGLSDFGLTIVTAHVSTYGERAVDVFYVKDRFGFKVSNIRLITKLRRRLLELVSNSPINKGAAA